MGDALHTNGGVTDAREARLAQAGLIAVVGPSALDARTGVMHGPDSTALVTGTSSTAPMRYAVAPHQWVTSRGAANGPYLGSLEAQQLVDTTAAPPSGQSRIDVIWVKQQDATAGVPSPDATTAPLYGCTQGAPSTGTPVKPAIPVGAEELATGVVSAGATATNGSSVIITNSARQTVARGAPIPVRTQAERDAITANGGGYPGLEVRRLDLPGLPTEVYLGGNSWAAVGWTGYTPALTASGTNPTLGSGGAASGFYKRIGKTIFGEFSFTFGGTGISPGSGVYELSLPAALASQTYPVGNAYLLDFSPNTVQLGILVPQSSTTVRIWRSGASSAQGATEALPWVWADSDRIRGFFQYEAA